MSYEEMLALTEEQLATQGVTKGARHKIIISIRKLKERYNTLCQLEKVRRDLIYIWLNIETATVKKKKFA
jgi:hypothetical protein